MAELVHAASTGIRTVSVSERDLGTRIAPRDEKGRAPVGFPVASPGVFQRASVSLGSDQQLTFPRYPITMDGRFVITGFQ